MSCAAISQPLAFTVDSDARNVPLATAGPARDRYAPRAAICRQSDHQRQFDAAKRTVTTVALGSVLLIGGRRRRHGRQPAQELSLGRAT
jgi:hypothetical protein